MEGEKSMKSDAHHLTSYNAERIAILLDAINLSYSTLLSSLAELAELAEEGGGICITTILVLEVRLIQSLQLVPALS